MQTNLAKLKKIELRTIWQHEALNFTAWLSQQENLDLLSEEIGVEIKPIKTEASVGSFRLDILAEEANSGRKIIIENQLEDTNHDHLGKIITYAAGFDAEIIIWIVADVREEHQRAIDWLNEHTDEKLGFFLIKIELWQIDDSRPAPKFEVLVSPNEWAKTIKSSPAGSELSETKLKQLDFWTQFKKYTGKISSPIRFGRSPSAQHWYDVSVGSAEAHIALSIDTRKQSMGCEIYIDRNKDLFNFLKEQQSKIESEIGEKAEWIDAAVASRIKIKKDVHSIFDSDDLENNFKWLHEKTALFQKVFGNWLREFRK